jgi:UDP-N-acetylmuramoyl-tripeptide--D-alanyl-D-alanine ligase
VAVCVGGLRWLRVAQREHYLPGAASRFALRWWLGDPLNSGSVVAAAAGVALAWRWPATGLVTAVVVCAGPSGLGLRGRTSPLAWTRRLRTLTVFWGAVEAVVIAAGAATGEGPVAAAAAALAVPVLVDLACTLTGPFERVIVGRYVRRATERLGRVSPTVVAITGSYGKTSTKGYVAHLLSGSRAVVASPASFNNRAGLARAVNEHLADGTEVFVAEMGTYGRGEIAELCTWLAPDIAVITAIGPVHLERFRSEESVVEAKAEILEGASCAVLVVDDPRLAALAGWCEARHQRVRRVSAVDPAADVCVCEGPEGLAVFVDGDRVLDGVPLGARPGNVACAVAVALELGLAVDVVAGRVATLPTTPHRLEAGSGAGGYVVLDDTYNSNPAGARAALEALAAMAPSAGRRVVVTPGMVELGSRQAEENAVFAENAGKVASHLVVVGRTNRRALLRGARRAGGDSGSAPHRAGPVGCVVVDRRDQAVAWVRGHLGQGDIVLYENDLPDHYP